MNDLSKGEDFPDRIYRLASVAMAITTAAGTTPLPAALLSCLFEALEERPRGATDTGRVQSCRRLKPLRDTRFLTGDVFEFTHKGKAGILRLLAGSKRPRPGSAGVVRLQCLFSRAEQLHSSWDSLTPLFWPVCSCQDSFRELRVSIEAMITETVSPELRISEF